jgi:phage shock protein A
MGFFASFFGRAGRVAKGQANQGMTALENATFEATVRQTVRDMKTELQNVVRASAEAMSNYNRLEAEYRHHSNEAEQWQSRAKQALSAGNEDLARKALAKKHECDERRQSLEPSLKSAHQMSEKLRGQVAQLRTRIAEGERNASTLIARKNAAAAQKKVAQAMAGIGEADNAFAALRDFEESVKREEAEALAYDTMSIDADSELEREFAALETSNVDFELEALRLEINVGALPSADRRGRLLPPSADRN